MTARPYSRHYGAFSRPAAGDKGVPRRTGLPSVRSEWLLISVTGRTIRNLPIPWSVDQIDDVADEVGYERPNGWKNLSLSQRLDLIATSMIEASRPGRAKHSEFILSPGQWKERTSREIPMNHEQLQAVVTHVPWARLYRGRLVDTEPAEQNRAMQKRAAHDEEARAVKKLVQ